MAEEERLKVQIEVVKTPTPKRRNGNGNMFLPHLTPRRASPRGSDTQLYAPEQKLTLLALRLAVLEKLATALGYLAFIWATVVLLGGFVSSLDGFDFWVIAGLLLTEGTRVFSRSSELEWQQTNANFTAASSRLMNSSKRAFFSLWSHFISCFKARVNSDEQVMNPGPSTTPPNDRRTWSWGAVHFIPHARFFTAKAMSFVLYVVELCSAFVSIGFSLARLIKQHYGNSDPATGQTESRNRDSALNLFYSLMLAEASVFLLERSYWEYKFRFQKLLRKVNQECGLTEDDLSTVKQFYYKVYSICLDQSVFSGLNLDLVGYSLDKMSSSIREELLGSVKVLCALADKEKPGCEAIRRRIGASPGALERLAEMVTWSHDKEIRRGVSQVLGFLVQQKNNCYRLTAIAGALEGVATLLLQEEDNDTRVDGLYIFKNLAKDHRNCFRIGNTTGLIPMVVQCIRVRPQQALEKASMEWKVVKKALQLLCLMVDTGGESGQSLRNRIALMVYCVRNLKGILFLDKYYAELQAIALDILKGLANDGATREVIGATGGVIPSLLSLFKSEELEQNKRFPVSVKAGEALNLLAFHSPKNCTRILNHKHYKQHVGVSENLKELIKLLQSQSKRRADAARILRSLCKNLNKEEIPEVTEAAPEVLNMALNSSDTEEEAGISLLAAILMLLSDESYDELLGNVNQKQLLADKVMQLVSLTEPPPHLIRIRRYSVELVSVLMSRDAFFVQAFKKDGMMERRLEAMLDTVSDVENFYTFSGSMGIARHSESIEEIIIDALQKL